MLRLLNKLIMISVLIVALSLGSLPVWAETAPGACAITPDKLDGQGLSVSGLGLSVSGLGLSVSGLGLSVSGLSIEQVIQDIWMNPVTPEWLTQLLPGVVGGTNYNSVPAAILIVDDFSSPTSHGNDVRKVFDDLVSAINAASDPDPVITLINVDVSGADSNSTLIAAKIRDTVNGLLPTYQHFAVNMSFGLVPCEDPAGTIITDSESGATYTVTQPFSYAQLQEAISSTPPVQNAAVRPILECVVKHDNRRYTAYFGYQNDNTAPVTIPIGANNRLHPSPDGQGQPTVFMPGRQEFVFAVEFNSGYGSGRRYGDDDHGTNRVWKLRGPDGKTRTATASNNPSQRCTTPPTLQPIQYGVTGYGGLTEYTQSTLGIPANFVDDYLEYLENKGTNEDDPLTGLRPLLQEYLVRSAQEASDANPATQFALIPVASSGNFRTILGSTPLVPANFPEAIATSATLGTFGDLWVLSHDGNVRAPGAGYILATDSTGAVTRVGAGTSFAAPYVSTLAALWLTYPNACEFGTGQVPLVAGNTKSSNAIATVSGNTIAPLACSQNLLPTIMLNSTVTLDEGGHAAIGTITNPDGDVLTITSSLAGSSVINDNGTLIMMVNDGPLVNQTATITVTDSNGGTASATTTVTVNNVAPVGQLTADKITVTAGETVTLAIASVFDPSSVDMSSGFTYAFNCGTGYASATAANTALCSYTTVGSFTARGTVADKDGGSTETSVVITVNAPVVSVCYANSVVSYVPGTRKNGTPILPARTNPAQALGAPQSNDTENFVSLGFGNRSTTGLLIVDFYPNYLHNVSGKDVRVWETSFGDSNQYWSRYPEAVKVYASQNGTTWVYLGTTTDKDQAYELGSLTWARYIKLVDVSDPKKFGSTDDGFDVDAIVGTGCATVPR